MVSAALTEWRGDRRARIDELLAAHRRIGGTGAGRRYGTEQLNWALTLRVAAEFQGFARDLHDEAIDWFAPHAGRLNARLSGVIRARLVEGRNLDHKNATPKSLGSDFGRLGMVLWSDLSGRYASTTRWRDTLEAMNKARNAIAHDDQQKFAELAIAGWRPSQLATIRRFRGSSSGLAEAMDKVVGLHLDRLFGEGKPW